MSFNSEIADIFEQMAGLLELTGANKFRVNAHAKASRVIKDLTTDLEPLAKAEDIKELVKLEGIGKGTATKLVELARTGCIAEHEELSAKVPTGVMAVMEVQGLGPKTVKMLWEEKGVESIDDLKKIIADGSIMDLPRMGAKTVENIRASIEFLEAGGTRLHIGLAQRVADRFVELLENTRGTERVAFAGSLRRGRETIGDVDILVVTKDPDAAREAFTSAEEVTQVLASGETKCSIRMSMSPTDRRFKGYEYVVQVDLRIVPKDSWGAALMYFTGSKEHNVRLRERAIKRGMTLNEYGLFEDDGSDPTPPQQRGVKPIASKTEESIYKALEMPFIPPTMREDRGEMSLTEPVQVVEVADIKAELHSHTTASDGKMTIEESAEIAKSRGYHTLAITDHSQSSAVAGGLKPDRLREHMAAVREADKTIKGIKLLAGSEVDILVDGSLDYDDELLHELDVVVASPHVGLKAKPAQATKRLLKAIRHPMVHIIGHPTGRLIERRPGLEPDMNELIAAAIEHDVALEINAHWMRLDLRDTHVRAAVEAGALISINCDDHSPGDYDNIRFGVLTAQRGWLTPERCINTWSAKKLHGWLKSKR
ncbi:MAG: DNA polymerase/3'-5' exonuclease PolX [Phycisphaerales bacterium]|nr:DNA polymerase/3'-5' exonuclease PolX [Phycisphaerales bacterium]